MKIKKSHLINPPEKLTVIEFSKKAGRNGNSKSGVSLSDLETSPFTDDECRRLLGIVAKTSRIKRHYDLFQLVRSEDIQYFIPHQVLIAAWGDFGGLDLKLDVISAIPGVRTGLLKRCTIYGLLKDLHKRWIDYGRQPMLLDSTIDARLARSACDCALHKCLDGIWSLLVHGVFDAREGGDSLYLALNPSSIVKGHSVEHFRFLADATITQIEIAFRRIGAMKPSGIPANEEIAASLRLLSARENEILSMLAEGKTNVEIAKILAISSFTVKNHVQRIMKKLNAANRTEAVAKYRQMFPQPRRRKPGEKLPRTD